VGGVEGYLGEFIRALAGAGHDVAFWCETDRPLDRDPIVLPRGVPAMCVADRGATVALGELVAWKPDLIYAHGFDDPGIESQLLGIGPSIAFAHNYSGMCISGGKTFTRPVVTPCRRVFGWPCLLHYFPHGCGGRSPSTMVREYRRQSRRLAHLRRYDAVVTHTDYMCHELARHGLTPRRIAYPVRGAGSPTGRPAPRQTWRLLFAGRMDRLKGGHVLLEALARVKSRLDQEVQVTFAGDGPERMRWEHLAADVQRTTPGVRIEFIGWVDPARLSASMADADLLVVPSLWPEPFGAVGPIAGCQNLPAAAFDVGGISQWLVDGVSGSLAPGHPPTAEGLADAIVRCLSDLEVHERLRRGACDVAGRFRMDAHLAAILDVFEGVLARRAAGGRPASDR
jgi:glycosyltransferase involved in cell wall biosynthesis